MKRTTLLLPYDLADLVDQERRRLDVSAAEVVRRALAAYFGKTARPTPLPFFALGRSGDGNLAENVEQILAQDWTYEHVVGVKLGQRVNPVAAAARPEEPRGVPG